MIQKGDRVYVQFEHCDCIADAIVQHVPVATGDSWHLLLDDGTEVYVQHFAAMYKFAKEKQDEKS